MEIVIENPVESPPPPPPPPPPLPPPLTSTYNDLGTAVNKPSLGPLSLATSSSMPAATTVMTITIAENPTAASHTPVRFSYRETYSANALSCASSLPGDTYARRGQRRPYDDPEGAPSVRRIDKSGLLGITEPEPSGHRVGLRSPRFLTGVGSSGIVSPRRFECIGQLDPVPEVPGQPSRGNVAPGAVSGVYPSGVPAIIRENRMDSCEALSVATLGRPAKSSSFDSLEARGRLEVESMQTFERSLEGIESSSGYGSFRFQDGCEARARTLGRLSRLSMKRAERENAIEGLTRYSDTCCNFPFKVRAPTVFPGVEGASSLPMTRATTTPVTSSTTTSVSSMREVEGTGKEVVEVDESPVPGEERAEAEGCEQGPTRNPMKDESSPRGDELLDNDAIQTLRVIILSEQL
ncbi:uncharacterized protein LOC143360228 [Halictus rubicundus]|uniref:uncharacterized protein LOC143360228 n=1 Tax=Halictus rubicundus TaxID=77578 RepID=UPI004036A2E1